MQVVPHLVARMVFHSCQCGTIATWEDEPQPTRKAWRRVALLFRDHEVVIINHGRPLSADFAGLS